MALLAPFLKYKMPTIVILCSKTPTEDLKPPLPHTHKYFIKFHKYSFHQQATATLAGLGGCHTIVEEFSMAYFKAIAHVYVILQISPSESAT